MSLAIIAITGNGARLGTRLKESLAAAELYVLAKHHGKAGKGAVRFDGELKALLAELWPKVSGFICIMATGIVVRLVAPHLRGKDTDPAVVVMDDAGKFAISLLSGHLGGGNELAERAAFVTGARAVITTATDANELPAFDMLAKENGWAIEELSRVKALNALLLEGAKIAVYDETGLVRPWFHGRGNLIFCDSFVAAMRSGAQGYLFVSVSIVPPQLDLPSLLVLRPRRLFLGIGCNAGTAADEILDVVVANLRRLFLSAASLAAIGTAAAKREEPGLLEAAARLGVPLFSYSSDELNAIAVPSPPSPHALAAIGAAGVAEPAALLAAGDGELLLQKVKRGNVTLAIAERRA